MDKHEIVSEAQLQNVQILLKQAIERLQDVKAHPGSDPVEGIAEAQVAQTLEVVMELLPVEIQEQIQTILVLRNDLNSPYLERATTITQLHRRRQRLRNDLPGWAQPE